MIVCIYGEIWFNREIENKNLLIDIATPIKEVEKVGTSCNVFLLVCEVSVI